MTNIRNSFCARPVQPHRHLLSLLILIGVLLVYTPQTAVAYDWCSVDPVYTFQRGGLATTQEVDVQVLVPLSALPLAGTATVTVTVPQDVASQEVVNTSTPLFVLHTVLETKPDDPTTTTYPLTFAVLVPATTVAFPVRLVVTDVHDGTVTIVDGTAGQSVSTTLQHNQ